MTVKKTIRKDLSDELEARHGYKRLEKTLRGQGKKRAARTVGAIAKDEADHFRLLNKIRKTL